MDKEYIRTLEEKCIQDCSPGCQSLCPFHVDVRKMLEAVQSDDFSLALKVYEKAVIFPGILSRICDAPCSSGCLRKDLGGAVSIPLLEESAVHYGLRSERVFRILRKRDDSVAVIGGGLCGLTAALYLYEKGYDVDLYESRSSLGGRILDFCREVLPPKIIQNDFKILQQTKIRIITDSPVSKADFNRIRERYPAVLAASGGGECDVFKSLFEINNETLATQINGVFAAGSLMRKSYSPSLSTADGRRAAISIDRFLQGVSLTAGRAGEQPFESCLYSNTGKVQSCEAVKPESGGAYSRDEAVKEAKRCLLCECMECVNACKLLEHYESYPRRYVRELSNSVNQFYGVRKTKHMLNGCTDCGLCAELCPNDLSMGDICTIGKRELVERGIMPPAIHDFPIQDMIYSNSEHCSIRIFPDGAEYLYFPGCQLQALLPDLLVKSYESLLEITGGRTGLYLGCCGAPADWAGRLPLRNEVLDVFRTQWEKWGSPEIIYACTSCRKTLNHVVEDKKLVSLWELFDRRLSLDGLSAAKDSAKKELPTRLAIADPCTGRHLPVVRDSVRNLFRRQGCYTVELPYNGELTRCCGFGGLVSMVEPEVGREMIKERISESEEDYGVYCAMCQDNFTAEGKTSYHLLELLYGLSASRTVDGGRLSYSRRQENRRLVREEIRLRWVGSSPAAVDEEWECIELLIFDGLSAKMEERMILYRDLQKVVYYAQKTGRRIFNPKTGRYTASLKPGVVTYWAEYSPEENGKIQVYNAYSHRLEVME